MAGLVKIRNNDALKAESDAREAVNSPIAQTVSSLSSHMMSLWSAARQAKIPIEHQMLKNLRQRNGIYEMDKIAAIRQMGGSEVYMLLTNTKCIAAEAWIGDVLSPVAEKPWTIAPTPIPEIPGDIEAEIRAEVGQVFQEVIQQAKQFQEQLNPMDLQDELRMYKETRIDEALKEVQEEAKLRAGRMESKMSDQMEQGGWHDSFGAVVSDLVTLKAGILKGPVLRRRKVKKWQRINGKWSINVIDEIVPEFDRVNPFDMYPAPDSRNPDDGYLFERHSYTKQDLISMIGVPGYSEVELRKAIQNYGDAGRREWLPTDTDRAMIEFGTTFSLTQGHKIEALEFWGSVPGKLLIDWGMSEHGIDPDLEYEVNALQIGSYTVRALLNPDKLGRKPYSVDSYERIPGSFWGKGIPELMADCQDVCNAVARSIVNNSAFASGPQVEVNTDRCIGDAEELWPWKIWQTTNQQMIDGPAVRFNQPQMYVESLLKVFEFFSALSEDSTGVPRWAYGNTALGGAGATASGLTALMTNASRGIKAVIGHLDKMNSAILERLYDYNMMYDPDDNLKGDCMIVVRGSSALVAKEQKIVRRTEFLAATANPMDAQLIGLKNRSKLLMKQAQELDMEIEDDPELQKQIEVLAKQIQAQAAQQAAQSAAPSVSGQQAPAASPRALDSSGAPQGGADSNLHQNQPGVTP
jgi:hypothetical protein